jgi:hypothetical protein
VSYFLAITGVILVLGGCAVVLGSGAAGVNVDRRIEVASDNNIEKTEPVDKIKGK